MRKVELQFARETRVVDVPGDVEMHVKEHGDDDFFYVTALRGDDVLGLWQDVSGLRDLSLTEEVKEKKTKTWAEDKSIRF